MMPQSRCLEVMWRAPGMGWRYGNCWEVGGWEVGRLSDGWTEVGVVIGAPAQTTICTYCRGSMLVGSSSLYTQSSPQNWGRQREGMIA